MDRDRPLDVENFLYRNAILLQILVDLSLHGWWPANPNFLSGLSDSSLVKVSIEVVLGHLNTLELDIGLDSGSTLEQVVAGLSTESGELVDPFPSVEVFDGSEGTQEIEPGPREY